MHEHTSPASRTKIELKRQAGTGLLMPKPQKNSTQEKQAQKAIQVEVSEKLSTLGYFAAIKRNERRKKMINKFVGNEDS